MGLRRLALSADALRQRRRAQRARRERGGAGQGEGVDQRSGGRTGAWGGSPDGGKGDGKTTTSARDLARRSSSYPRFAASARRLAARSLNGNFRRAAPQPPKNALLTYFSLAFESLNSMYVLAQIARACGRVSVGGTPDKRPEKRLRIKPAAGGEPANSVCTEDRDLKQRRTGLFRLCRPSKGRLTEEASLSCRACGTGLPIPIEGR